MIHYHGTPISPRSMLLRMKGRNFCVSHAEPRDAETCLAIGQSVMFDNGAFSAYTQGRVLDVSGYYGWLADKLAPPHWAVIPDQIDGTLDDQQRLRAGWPRHTLGWECAAPVFHLHFDLNVLMALCLGYSRVCLGSSGQYWQVGGDAWCRRMDQIFNMLAQRFSPLPWIHGLRMLGQTDGGWPLASADSANVGRNYKTRHGCPEKMAEKIDGMNPSRVWVRRPEQEALW